MKKEKKVEQLQEEAVPEEAKEAQPVEKVAEVVEETTEEAPSEEKPVEEAVEEAPAKEVTEDAPEEEKTDDAPKAEALQEEAPAEEVKEEEPAAEEEAVEEAPKEEGEGKEALQKDISETKEELQVIKEVRDELVTLYAHNKDLEVSRESLSKELETLKTESKDLKEQLSRYKEAEQAIAANKRQVRLEQLSAKFKTLGQEKTIEQLSEKDEDTLEEFEKIVDAAIEKSGEVKEIPEATIPSQAIGNVPESEAVISEGAAEQLVTPKPENDNQFFTRMVKKMAGTQATNTRNGKVIEL